MVSIFGVVARRAGLEASFYYKSTKKWSAICTSFKHYRAAEQSGYSRLPKFVRNILRWCTFQFFTISLAYLAYRTILITKINYVILQNRRKSSPRYCRPIEFIIEKETTYRLQFERNLNQTTTEISVCIVGRVVFVFLVNCPS